MKHAPDPLLPNSRVQSLKRLLKPEEPRKWWEALIMKDGLPMRGDWWRACYREYSKEDSKLRHEEKHECD